MRNSSKFHRFDSEPVQKEESECAEETLFKLRRKKILGQKKGKDGSYYHVCLLMKSSHRLKVDLGIWYELLCKQLEDSKG